MLMTQDVLIEEIISSFWENIYFELFSFSIKRAARRGCDILLTSLGGGLQRESKLWEAIAQRFMQTKKIG